MSRQALAGVTILFLVGLPGSLSAAVFDIPGGNVDALAAAIEVANENGEPDIIKLAPGGHYQAKELVGEIDSRIIINGRGSTIEGAPDWRGPRLFTVSSAGSLVLQNLHIDNFETQAPLEGASNEGGIIRNEGHTVISDSTLSRAVTVGFKAVFGSVIKNNAGAQLEFRNVTITMNEAEGGITKGGAIFNLGGDVVIRNSTVTGNTGEPGGIVNGEEGTVTLVNSIVAGNEGGDCEGDGFISLGHNIDGDGSCGLDEPSDLPETDPQFGTFGDHGGLVPTVALEPDSPAIGAADSLSCPPVDARGFVRAEAREFECDIGAFERNAKTHSIEPAHTASWFHPPQRGHGFNVEVLGPDRGEVLAYWYTYDPAGRPLWLLGVAPIEGHQAPMVMHRFEGMRFGEFDPSDNRGEPWGTLTLYFGSCERGAATWQPLDAALPAGGMPLVRLTLVESLGCGG